MNIFVFVSRRYWAKNFGIHILRPPIMEIQKSNQPRIQLRINTPKTLHYPRPLIFHMIKDVEKTQHIQTKTKNHVFFKCIFGDLVALHSFFCHIVWMKSLYIYIKYTKYAFLVHGHIGLLIYVPLLIISPWLPRSPSGSTTTWARPASPSPMWWRPRSPRASGTIQPSASVRHRGWQLGIVIQAYKVIPLATTGL